MYIYLGRKLGASTGAIGRSHHMTLLQNADQFLILVEIGARPAIR